MPSVSSNGTQAAAIGTEHTLATISTTGTYLLVVDANAMQAGDTVELRILITVLAGSPYRVVYKTTLVDVQPDGDVARISVPVPVTHLFKATLKQTTGTGRSFDWEVIAL